MKRDKRADTLKKGDKIWSAGSSFPITKVERKTQGGRSVYHIRAKGLEPFILLEDQKITVTD